MSKEIFVGVTTRNGENVASGETGKFLPVQSRGAGLARVMGPVALHDPVGKGASDYLIVGGVPSVGVALAASLATTVVTIPVRFGAAPGSHVSLYRYCSMKAGDPGKAIMLCVPHDGSNTCASIDDADKTEILRPYKLRALTAPHIEIIEGVNITYTYPEGHPWTQRTATDDSTPTANEEIQTIVPAYLINDVIAAVQVSDPDHPTVNLMDINADGRAWAAMEEAPA